MAEVASRTRRRGAQLGGADREPTPATLHEPWGRAGGARIAFQLAFAVFALYPLAALTAARPGLLETGLVLVADALFIGLAAAGSRWPADDPRRAGPLPVAANLALTGLALAVSLQAPRGSWFWLFYYASTSAALVVPSARAARLMVVAGLAAAAVLLVAWGDPAGAAVQGISVAVIGLILLTSSEARRMNAQLVAARHELALLAVADERARIARDLHDTLGHSLSVIALKSELAGRLLPAAPERAREEIADVERVAREALAAARETVSGYRQPSLSEELAGARRALAAAGIEALVEPAPEGLPRPLDTILAWAVREGVTNVLRHSGAGRAIVRTEVADGVVVVEVVDDGRGPGRPERRDGASADGRARGGSGLSGLGDRVAGVGGVVETGPASTDGAGFRLRVSVPLAEDGR